MLVLTGPASPFTRKLQSNLASMPSCNPCSLRADGWLHNACWRACVRPITLWRVGQRFIRLVVIWSSAFILGCTSPLCLLCNAVPVPV